MKQQLKASTTSQSRDISSDMSSDTPREIHCLPIHFDPTRLADELSHFTEADWVSHPQEGVGDRSIPLVSVGGTQNIDYAIAGFRPAHPTPTSEKKRPASGRAGSLLFTRV